MQRTQTAKTEPGNAICKVREQEHKGQQEAHQHADNSPEKGSIQELLYNFVVIVELLYFHDLILVFLRGLLGLFFFFLFRWDQFIFEEHADRRRIRIIVLPASNGSDKSNEKDQCNGQTDYQQHIYDAHTYLKYRVNLRVYIPLEYDIYHLLLSPISRAAQRVAVVTKATTLIELNGMRIAAITGTSCPVTAK